MKIHLLLPLLLSVACASPGAKAPSFGVLPSAGGAAKTLGSWPNCSNNGTDKVMFDSTFQFQCGDDQRGGTLTLTNVSATRTVNTNYVIDATRPVEAWYTVTLSCVATLLGGQSTTVTMLSDAANPPTTPVGGAGASNNVALGVAITLTNGQTGMVGGWVLPGHYVRLNAVNTGTGCTTSVAIAREQAFAVL